MANMLETLVARQSEINEKLFDYGGKFAVSVDFNTQFDQYRLHYVGWKGYKPETPTENHSYVASRDPDKIMEQLEFFYRKQLENLIAG